MQSKQSWRGRRRSWRPALYGALALSALLWAHLGTGSSTVYARQWGAPPPPFVDPSTGQVNPAIVAETHDKLGTHVTYKDGAEVTNGTLVTKLPLPADGKTGAQSDDYQALVANHGQLVVVPLDKMVLSTTGVATEAGPWVTQSGCVGPPANFNIATATDAQLALYGFAPVGSMPRDAYNAKFSWMKHRDCRLRAMNSLTPHNTLSGAHSTHADSGLATLHPQGDPTHEVNSSIWTGNIADESNCQSNPPSGLACPVGTPNTLSEADSDYYVPTISYPGGCWPECTSSYWVGLGGTSPTYELVQGGVEGDELCSDPPLVCNPSIYPWIEWVGNAGTVGAEGVGVSGIWMGTHVYTRVTAPNTVEIGNIDTQQFSTFQAGQNAAENSAEFIVEDVNTLGGIEQGLTKFTPFTFYGMGITYQDGYRGMNQLPHDYTVAYWGGDGPQLMNIGSINNDPGDYPYDENTITWLAVCNAPCA